MNSYSHLKYMKNESIPILGKNWEFLSFVLLLNVAILDKKTPSN